MNNAPASIPWWSTLKKLAAGRVPGQVVIQYTDDCNATCTHCGMSATRKFPRFKLLPEQVKPLLDRLASRGVMAVSFTGGEPLLYAEEIASCIRHARSVGIYSVGAGTNGFFFQDSERPGFGAKVAKYASLLVESGCTNLRISLDSAEPRTHETRRGLPGVVKGLRKGLPLFHEHGLYPAANLCINRNILDEELRLRAAAPDAFYERAHRAFLLYFAHVLELGFTTVNLCYPMLQAAADIDGIAFSHEEKPPLYRALFDAVTFFRPKLRIFTPRSALLSMIRGQETLGFPLRAAQLPTDFKQLCRQCDWECFRDLSHLFGPLVDAFKNPWAVARRFARDREWSWLWAGDMRYYRACGWFHGRIPPRAHL